MSGVKTRYKKTVELNNEDSPSTGSITIYDGEVSYDEGPFQQQFIEITDCQGKIRLLRSHFDNESDWIDKVKKLINSIEDYLSYLTKDFHTINDLVNEEQNKQFNKH